MTRHYIVATAGHVDHGKSALVKALTGTDPDRLPEEKARGITIDLGFAGLNLESINGERIHAGIVDVPGHEDFVRNMIAGIGSVDLALLVVAADDGWMPQTEEHFRILGYLGVGNAVIALTKCDLGRTDRVTEQICNRLGKTAFASSPVIETSVRTGEGIERLKTALATELSRMTPQPDYGKPRLFIDRVFTLQGIGTVVTGTLTGGRLCRGQRIVIQPHNLNARIRSVQSHGQDLEFVQPGMRTAINLPDVALDEIHRGNVVAIDGVGSPSATLTVRLEQSSRSDSSKSLKIGSSIYFHHGTSRVRSRVTLLDGSGLARLTLASPIFAFLGDHFVVRDPSERHTIGGGIILDPDGVKGREFSANSVDVRRRVRDEVAAAGFVRKESLLLKSHFAVEEIQRAVSDLAQANEIVIRGEIAVEGKTWETLVTRAGALIDDAHSRNPERAGIDLNELRTALALSLAEIFDPLIAELATQGFVRLGSHIARVSHRPKLPERLKRAEERILEALSRKPFDPPARKEIEAAPDVRQALRFLIETDQVVEIGSDILVVRTHFERMKALVIEFISKNGAATVSELRQALASSRRVMVPFLERLDRDGITRRLGDKRSLR